MKGQLDGTGARHDGILRLLLWGGAVALLMLPAMTGFLETWANLAVGFLGEPGNPANFLFFGIVGIALVGALLARLRPHGLAVAMTVAALAQVGGSVYAIVTGYVPEAVISLVLAGMWVASAWLFQRADRQTPREQA